MLLPPKPPSLINLEFWCDSSSHRGHNYMVIGGVAIRRNRSLSISSDIEKLKELAGVTSELKWTKYKGGCRSVLYKAVIDLFFALIEEKHAHFHCIISHFREFDHNQDAPGNEEKSVNKLHFQLSLHRVAKFYGRQCAIFIYPDKGEDSNQFVNFRNALCATAYKSYKTRANCIKVIQPKDSSNNLILQMVDIIIGAIAADMNQRSLAAHKQELAKYVLSKAKLENWAHDSSLTERCFTIWHFRKKPTPPDLGLRHG
jgi:hypothetical protein